MRKFQTSSSKETKNLGAEFAEIVSATKPQKSARVLALSGELGAGKTTFTQGFLKALGVKERVMSPTFIIMRRTSLKNKSYENVFHIDAYRLKSPNELKVLDFKAIIKNPKNIVIIEWPEKVKTLIPKNALWMNFSHNDNPKERTIIAKK